MALLQDLIAHLRLDASGFTGGLNISMKEWEEFNSKMLKAGAALTAGVTLPIVGIGTAALQMATELKSAEIGFTTMMGSAEAAQEHLEELKQFAATTPFEFSDLVKASQRMQALGFAAKDVIPNLTAIGNAAAGLGGGAELINRLTLALGQMGAKGKVSAEEMRQLAEAGIPAWQILADKIGVSIPEAMKMAERGAIQAAEAIPALIEGMNAKFGGLMEGFSQTAMGRFSNLKDQIGFILADIGNAILPLANTLLEKFLIPGAEKVKQLVAAFASLPEPVKAITVVVAALAAAVGPVIVAFAGFSSAMASIGAVLGTTGIVPTLGALASTVLPPLAIAIGAVAAAWGLWQLEPVRNAVHGLWETITGFWNDTLKPFLITVGEFGALFLEVAGKIAAAGLQEIWMGVSAAAQDLWKWLTELWQTGLKPLWDALVQVWEALEPVRDVLYAVGAAIIALNIAQFIILWNGFKLAVELVWNVLKGLASLIGDVLLIHFQGLAKGAQAVADVFRVVIRPAIDLVIEKLGEFLGWIAKIPGVSGLIEKAGVSFGNMQKQLADNLNLVTGGLGKQTEATQQLTFAQQAALKIVSDRQQREKEAAQAAVENAKKQQEAIEAATKKLQEAKAVHAELLELKKQGKAADEDVAKELIKVTQAQDALNKLTSKGAEEQHKLKLAQGGVNEELKAAKRNYTEVKAAFSIGQASAENLAKALDRLQRATAAAHPELKETGVVAQSTAKQISEHARVVGILEDSLRKAEAELRLVKEQYAIQRATAEQLAAAEKKVQEIFSALHPEFKKHAATLAEMEEANRKFNESLDELKVNLPAVAEGYDQMLAAMVKEPVDEFTAAMRRQGIESVTATRQAAEQAKKDYETISGSSMSTAGQVEQAWRKMIAAERAYAEAIGDTATVEALDKIVAAHDKAAKGTEGIWSRTAKQVSTIISDMGKDFADAFMGLFDNSENEKLDEQAAELRASLDERTQDLEDFRVETENQIAKVTENYKTKLEEEEAALAASLEERETDYAEYAQEVEQDIAELREKHARELEEEVTELRSKLADKVEAHEEYKAETLQRIEEIREDHAESLARELADLEDSLRDRTQAYEDFVTDTNIKLGRIGEDVEDRIADETRETRRGIADKQKAYKRDEEDILDRINRLKKAGKKESDQEVQDLRKQLARKKEDLDEYVREAEEDLADFTTEQRREAERQTADAKRELEQRTRDYNEFLAENKSKVDEVTQKHNEAVEEQTADLLGELAKRERELEAFRVETETKIASVTKAHTDAMTAEETELRNSLADRKVDLEAYRAEVAAKHDQIKNDYAAKLSEEVTELRNKFTDRLTEYDNYRLGVEQKLTDLENAHKGPLERIGGMFADIFTSAGNALLRFVGEEVMGALFGKIDDLLLKIPGIGTAFESVFSNIPGLDQIFGGVDGILGGATESATSATGAAGSPLGSAISTGLSGIVGAIGGIASAVTGVIGVFQAARQENTLNAIEESTRRGTLFLGDRADGGILGQLFTLNEEVAFGTTNKAILAIRDYVAGPFNDFLSQISYNSFWTMTNLDGLRQDVLAGFGSVAAAMELAAPVAPAPLMPLPLPGDPSTWMPLDIHVPVYLDGQLLVEQHYRRMEDRGVRP